MANGNTIYKSALVAILGIAVVGSTLALTQRSGDYEFFDPIIEVKSLVSRRFVEEPDEDAMQRSAISGMLEVLDDPHTVYIPPSLEEAFDKETRGEYVGIGALVQNRDGWLTIVTPLEDSPAFQAGLIADDRILEVGGTSTLDRSVEECVEMLVGEPGTPITLTIERDGVRSEVEVTRDRIVTRTIKGFRRTGEDGAGWDHIIDPQRRVGYIRLTQFTPTSSDELRLALESIDAESGNLGGLILDLRGNPGGVLGEAVAMADMFLDDGVIVSTRGRSTPEETARASKPGTLPDFPMIVLINGQSASASEVLAGALVEHDRAITLGERSFGKGSVQGVYRLRSNPRAQLKITEQGYFLPSGRSIQRRDGELEWGVDPTAGFHVSMTVEDTIAMLTARRDQEIIRGGQATDDSLWSSPAWITDTVRDLQLAAAVDAIQQRIDGATWTPTGDANVAGDTLVLEELTQAEDTRNRILRELTRLDRRIQTLEAGISRDDPEPDLWDDEREVVGGRLQVTDSAGQPVATLRITEADIERWLIAAGVTREDDGAE